MIDIDHAAEHVLALMRKRGFDDAQVGVSCTERRELNVAHNEPSLMRSSELHKLSVVGLKDGRRAATEGSDLGEPAMQALVDALWASTTAAPQDEANAVSSGQRARIVQGPQRCDTGALATAMRELLAWRAAQAPTVMLEEAQAAHVRSRLHMLTSGGSDIACELGWHELTLFGLACEGTRTSSFNYCGGTANSLAGVPQLFGADRMMLELARQVDTRPLGNRFVGEVVFTPHAVASLLGWLMHQLGDGPLIDGSSLYRQRVGECIASPLLTLQSRYDAPGCVPVSSDAFCTPAVTLLERGRLLHLTPSLYGSRKTGVPHLPVAGDGWELLPGRTPLADLIAAVPRGALVDRLSMGDPAPNGDFSGVIKNSFVIADGQVGPALAETMIAGNVAQLLLDVQAVSTERLDSGSELLPWLRVGGLHFS